MQQTASAEASPHNKTYSTFVHSQPNKIQLDLHKKIPASQRVTVLRLVEDLFTHHTNLSKPQHGLYVHEAISLTMSFRRQRPYLKDEFTMEATAIAATENSQ